MVIVLLDRLTSKFWQLITVVIAVVLIWLFLLSEVSIAQELPSSAPEVPLERQSRSSLSSSDISSEKVNQFIQAYLQVLHLVDQREGELQGAETELESLQVEQEIEVEAIAIIEAAGLTRQEYLQLLGLVNLDPEFGERIAAQLQELS
jgi:hypothetical protein